MKTATTLVLAGSLTLLASTAGAQDRSRVDTTVAMGEGGALSVSIYAGRVNVTAGSGQHVRVQGRATGANLSVRSRTNGVRIQLDHGAHNDPVELDITVPVGTRVALEGFSAAFSIRGVKGEASVETLAGPITVVDAAGRVALESVSGNIEAEGVRGNIRVESVNGRVTVRNVEGDVTAESVSGRVTISGASSRRVNAETVNGSLSYDGTIESSGNYSFATHSGSITLAVPANAGATVSLETFSGAVDSDFPVTLESGATRTAGESQFEFRIGDGRSRIVLETFNGSIRIKRGSSRANQE